MVVKKYHGLDTDTALGGASASDETVSSQKAIKGYVDGYALHNTATKNTNGLKILGGGEVSGHYATILGVGANDGGYSGVTAIGYNSGRSSSYVMNSTAIGANAKVSKDGAIQIGAGTNSESCSLSIGFRNSSDVDVGNYKLLDSTGLIPIERLGGDSTSTNAKFLKENGTWAEIGGGVSTDGISITTNSSDEIQTIGVIDQNNTTNAIKTWTGTKAQYDAITTKDANTIYNITDDGNALQVALETIYPVGSIYIGTMAVCPLSALFGTWELVSSGRVLQGADTNHLAGTTIEAGLPNITGDLTDATGMEYGTGSGAIQEIKGNVLTHSGSASNRTNGFTFNASRSSAIYGNSDTVQPPAFIVNIWQRTM